MIDPSAVIELKAGNEVSTKDGTEEDVSRIAVWDWHQTENPDCENGEVLRCHTNSGEMYVDTQYVDEVIDLKE